MKLKTDSSIVHTYRLTSLIFIEYASISHRTSIDGGGPMIRSYNSEGPEFQGPIIDREDNAKTIDNMNSCSSFNS
jgi:hypothetical protein